jgi:hypothetical protein
MRSRFLATAALAAAVCLGIAIGWLIWGSDSSEPPSDQAQAQPTPTPPAALQPTAPPSTPAPTATAESGAMISIRFGPEQIWNIAEGPNSRQSLDAIYQCAPKDIDWNDCIWQAMQQNGGSRDAFDFFKLAGGFLQDLQGEGQVKLGTIDYPWRANEIAQPILLGGDPPVVEVENPPLHGAVEHDPGFTILQSQHPNVLFWGSSPTLESASVQPDGSQSFIFRYRLLDGCHACPVLGYARVEYDFLPSGRLVPSPPKLLGVIEKEN